jgi:signal transduction histidine kinase
MWLDGQLRSADPAAVATLRDKVAALVPVTERLIETTQRISSTLRPGMLDDLGLVAAVEWLASDFAKRTGLACTTILPSEDIALNTARDVALFRIVQEALTNVIRHAHATCAEVRLSVADGEVLLDVQDDGRGTTPEQIAAPRSLGLLSMRERAAVLGGELDIKSEPGRGTTVRVRMPLAISPSL